MLTDFAIRSAKPTDKPRKLFDEKGLYLLIKPSGGRLWRFKYRFGLGEQRKENTLAFGSYPEISLAEARSRRDKARELVARAIDPAAERRKAAIAAGAITPAVRTVKVVALEWWKERRVSERWGDDYADQVKRQLERDVFPIFATRGLEPAEREALPLLKSPVGDWPFESMTPLDVLELCRNVEARGSLDTARDLRARIGMIYDREVVLGRCPNNPAHSVVKLLAKPKRTNFAAIPFEGLPEFFYLLDVYDMDPTTSLGLEGILATWLRSTELRLAHWEWLDHAARELRIPSEHMKNGDLGMGSHVVPLSDYAMDVFDRLRIVTGTSELMFPSQKHPGQPISDGCWLNALYRIGYRGRGTVHGIRAMGSTEANEAYMKVKGMPVPMKMWEARWIDRQLDHVDGTVSGVYNRAEYLEPRRALMQWWGQRIQEARRASANRPRQRRRPYSGKCLLRPASETLPAIAEVDQTSRPALTHQVD
jgi:hypothetical protein